MTAQYSHVVGTIHESHVPLFKRMYGDRPYIRVGIRPTEVHQRRIMCTDPNFTLYVEDVLRSFNPGRDLFCEITTPYIPCTLVSAGTTVPRRMGSGETAETWKSLNAAGFSPHYYPDAPQRYFGPHITKDTPVGTVGHWHSTLVALFSSNPWCEYYAMFQDDFICVKGLHKYIITNPCPADGYMNLYTFRENEALIHGKRGWVPGARQPDRMNAFGATVPGRQMGLGAVALIFRHQAVIDLLSSESFLRHRLNSTHGSSSLDGAIVTALGDKGWIEYIHAPSLVQHTGEESTMGNPRHAQALSFPGEDYNILCDSAPLPTP